MKIMETIKKWWKWVVGSIVLAVALLVWHLSRGESGRAARKILELQKNSEDKIQDEQNKKDRMQRHLDRLYEKESQKVTDETNKKIKKIKEKSQKLSEAALRYEVLKDLDDIL